MIKQKGIWIERFEGHNYITWLNEEIASSAGFVPFENDYSADRLGLVSFLNLADSTHSYSAQKIKKEGLRQAIFYPLGRSVNYTHPKLLGQDLARKIEIEIAKDLISRLTENSLILIKGNNKFHLKYLEDLRITSMEQMTLGEWLSKLEKK
ncbi:hypothetical protein KA107_02345 [Candidatus Pacearchaeota archaeon]|nr:hypothetical protein [Candidatus Pacearchaeota archaeon]